MAIVLLKVIEVHIQLIGYHLVTAVYTRLVRRTTALSTAEAG
jgi:hypothetical protein